MNREIKFRGIAKNGNNKGEFIYGFFGEREVEYDDGLWEATSGIYTNDGMVWEEIKEGTLGQYTGLKDKNGKEIYFGDILATSNANPEHDIWNKEDYGYTIVEEGGRELGVDFSNWYVDTEDDESIYSIMFVEVIGNVFENPNLLKESK